MSNSEREKHAWEREAIRLFVECYNIGKVSLEKRLRLLYQQEKPDAVLENGFGQKLGVEITHLFYSQAEAKEVFAHRSPLELRGPESFDHLLQELNVLIRKKEGKRLGYSMAYPVALLIRNASPGFRMSDLQARRHSIYLPPPGTFAHIWYLSREDGAEWQLEELM